MNNGPYIPERGAGLTPQDFPNLPSGPALGFNSCSLCGHGGTSGSILARIREYVTFYANSDADLSDEEPVPAPRLEWEEIEMPAPMPNRFRSGMWMVGYGWSNSWALFIVGEAEESPDDSDYSIEVAYGESPEQLKSLAEKLNDVLSPPVGTQPDDLKMEEAMDDFARHTTPGGTWIFEDGERE